MEDIEDAISAVVNAQTEIQRLSDNHSLYNYLKPVYDDLSKALSIMRSISDANAN